VVGLENAGHSHRGLLACSFTFYVLLSMFLASGSDLFILF